MSTFWKVLARYTGLPVICTHTRAPDRSIYGRESQTTLNRDFTVADRREVHSNKNAARVGRGHLIAMAITEYYMYIVYTIKRIEKLIKQWLKWAAIVVAATIAFGATVGTDVLYFRRQHSIAGRRGTGGRAVALPANFELSDSALIACQAQVTRRADPRRIRVVPAPSRTHYVLASSHTLPVVCAMLSNLYCRM